MKYKEKEGKEKGGGPSGVCLLPLCLNHLLSVAPRFAGHVLSEEEEERGGQDRQEAVGPQAEPVLKHRVDAPETTYGG